MRPLALPDRQLFAELRRRSVFKIGGAWLVGGWLLIQVADTVAPQFDLPGCVPRLVTLLVMLGFPIALVLAWAFEITPEGIERDARSRNTRFIAAFAVVLAMAALGWFFRAELAGRDFGDRSIAVLPFANLATDADSEVLADGLAEELLGALGRNPAFRVTARSSAFQFKGQNRDLREIGQRLGVRYILEGSVRMAMGRVRIGAQLVDTSDGSQMWSESYDRTLADLFALQRDIAYEVEQALEVVLVASERRVPGGTASVEAHMELLRALKVGASRAVRDLDQAIAHLQRAIALDPNYAAAYVELAYATFTRATQLDEDEAAKPVIAPLIDKALALDPGSGEALVLRGAFLTDDDELSEKTIRDGLALAPSHARGYEILAGHVAGDPARAAEATTLLDRAIALDPLSPRNYFVKAMLAGEEHSEPYLRKALEVDPRFRSAVLSLSMGSMARGNFATAIEFGERAVALDPDTPFLRDSLASHYLNLGDVAAARAANQPQTPDHELEQLLFAGDVDGAVALLRADERLRRPYRFHWPQSVVLLRDAHAKGTWAENVAVARAALQFDGSIPEGDMLFQHVFLSALLRGAGATDEADRLCLLLHERLRQSKQWGPVHWQRAMLLADSGHPTEALDELEKAFKPARPYWWGMLDQNPMFDSIREDPRYRALRARLDAYLDEQRAQLAELRRVGKVPVRTAAAGTAAP